MAEYVVEEPSDRSASWRVRERIVRCMDCKHMHEVRNWLGMDVDECWLHADRESGALGKVRTEPDGFCAWGACREVNDG